jgi:hypothetical protein
MKDRGRDDQSRPSLRTGQAVLPHPALQLMGSDSETEAFEYDNRLWRYRPFARAVVRLNSPASSKKRLGHRCRLIALGTQLFRRLLELLLFSGFEVGHALAIDSRAPRVAPYLVEGISQVFFPVDFVDQREPFSSFHSPFEGPQHTIGPYGVFHPLPSGSQGFFILFRLLLRSHCR